MASAFEGYVTMTFSEINAEHQPDTDAALLADGGATATALRAPCEATDAKIP